MSPTAFAPVIEGLTPGAKAIGQAGDEALLPFYRPVRPAFLNAAADLAVSIEPAVRALAEAPGTECVSALLGVLDQLLAT